MTAAAPPSEANFTVNTLTRQGLIDCHRFELSLSHFSGKIASCAVAIDYQP